MPPGRSVQVVTLVEDGKTDMERKLKLDTVILREILGSAKDLPIAVVAIAGPARSGKSFMLSYIVRYLEALERSEDGDPGDWMDHENPGVSMKGKGFEFSNSLERTTDGIWMWSRPFVITSGKSPFAILLLDTEGCFDPLLSEREQSFIIGLSLLLSSCFIFNESSRINENTLLTLAKFAQFGKIASQTFEGKAFQRLMFLVRDWNNPNIFDYGAAGGQGCILKTMEHSAKMSAQALQNRQNILENFEHFNAYLMPYPGSKVLSSDYNGCIADMSPEFQEHVEKFVTSIVSDVVPKKIGTEHALISSFYDLICRLVDAFNQDETNPTSMVDAITFAAFESQLRFFVKMYEKEFEEKIGKGNVPFHVEEKLQKYHQRFRKSIMDSYNSKRHPGTEDQKEIFGKKLQDKLESVLQEKLTENKKQIEDYIELCWKSALDELSLKIEKSIRSSNKIWFEPEFLLVVAKLEEGSMNEFLAGTKDVPQISVKPKMQMLQDCMAQLVKNTWWELQKETQTAEKVILEVILGLKSEYETLMELILSDDEALSEGKIIKAHEKQFRKAEKTFLDQIQKTFSDQDFISRSHSQLKATFQHKLEEYLSQNQEKLGKLVEDLDLDLADMQEAVDSSVAAHMKKMLSPDFEAELDEKLSGILDVAIQTLDERDVPDKKILNSYRQKIRSMLESSKDFALHLKQKKIEEKNATVMSHLEEFSNSLEEIVSSQEIFDLNDLHEEINIIYGDRKRMIESDMMDSDIDCGDFLQRFENLVQHEKEKAMQEYEKKIDLAESDIISKIKDWTQLYCEAMRRQEPNWNDLDDVSGAHLKVEEQIVLHFQNDPVINSFPSRIPKYKNMLEDKLHEIFSVFKANFKSKLNRRRDIIEKSIPSTLEEFRSSMREFIDTTRFVEDPELLLKLQEESQPLIEKMEADMSEVFDVHSREYVEAYKKFLDELSEEKMSLTKYSSEVKSGMEASIEDVISRSVTFAEQHASFKSLLLKKSEEVNKELKSAVESQFEIWWELPFDGEIKQEAWTKVIGQVQEKLQTGYEALLKKCERDEEAVKIISNAVLSNLCCHVELSLGSGKFYFEDALELLLAQGRMDAKAEFLKKLDDKDIPAASKLDDMTTKIEVKISDVREKNKLCRKTAMAEAESMCEEIFENRKSHCKTEEEMERVREDAEAKCLEYLRTKAVREAEDWDESLEVDIKNYCQETRKKVLESFKPENEEEITNEILDDAVRFYRDSMDKSLLGMPAINPKSLFEFHGFSMTSTLHKIRKTRSFVSKRLLAALQKRLNESYTVYMDKNSLRNAQETNTAIGIDLGTTTSCVAIFKHGNATVIPDNSGKNLTPSWVYFDDDGSTMVGNEAKNQASVFPEKTIFDAKRLIGRKFADPRVQEDMKTWPFTITGDRSGKPKINVGGKKYDPEHISALVLAHMKEIAEKHLSEPVTKAVITVPANFTDRQRDATKQAAEIAGLDVLQIINEPTAAATAHALNWNDDEKTVLVFDFGGGTFDVSILKTDFLPSSQVAKLSSENDTTGVTKEAPTSAGSRLKVLATRGHMHLGGEDMDHNMVKFCAQKFEEQHGLKLLEGAINENKRFVYRRLYRLRTACEEAKVILTTNDSASVSLDSIMDSEDLNVTITRKEFEEMNEHFFQEAIQIVEHAMDDAGIDKDEITDVLMVGGSSRIPRVKTLLQDFLGLASLTINQKVDIQEAVALGAAVQACILNGGSSVHALPMIKDIQPFSLGIEVKGGGMSVIIRRGTTIPKEAIEMYYTVEDDQDTVRITIFAGEDLESARNNFLLGEFFLKGIPPGSAGAQQIAVKMRVDESGILDVTATCTSTGGSHNLVIQDTRGRLTDEEIIGMRATMTK